MSEWLIDSEKLNGYPHLSKIKEGYEQNLPFRYAPSSGFGWGLDNGILKNYSHLRSITEGYDRGFPFRFFLSDLDYFGWKADNEMLDGYPFTHYRVLEPPEPPPPPLAEIVSMKLNVSGRYVGSETDVTVSLGLKNVLNGDGIKIQLSATHYEFNATLTNGAETFTYTIPTNIFTGLKIGSYKINAEISRDGEIADKTDADYIVVSAPTVTFENLQPSEIQLPISMLKTISSQWQAVGEGINRIQGNAVIGGLQSAIIDTSNQTFNVNFSTESNLTPGVHAISINLTIESNLYGVAAVMAICNDVLTVLPPIPEPKINEINLPANGRYIGNATPVTVTAELENISEGDSVIIRIRQGMSVFFEHTGNLNAEVDNYSHTISPTVFNELAVGVYSVQVLLMRNSATRDESSESYRIVDLPTVQLLHVSPNTIQLPMAHPETVNITLQVFGEGIFAITGTVALDDTDYSVGVNASNTQFIVPFENVDGLTPRGYSVAVNLSVVGNYGTITLTEEFHNAFRVLAEVVSIKRNLRSNTVYIYNGFTLVAMLRNYVSLKWVRRYNRSGEFILQLHNTPENVALAKEGYIISKDNDDEAGFIEDVTIGEYVEIKGAFISKMLSFRVVNFTSENLVNLKSTADSLINSNYIKTSPERIIPGFRIADYNITAQAALARIENGTVEQWLENQDIGFKVAFNPTEKSFDFSMYDGRRSSAEFCENFRNISDQQYFNQTSQARNVVIVEGQLPGMEEPQKFTIGSAQGLERREAFARAGRFPPFEFGQQFLKQNEAVKSLDVKIVDPYEPFEYRKDYDIGDIVTIVSESYGVTITQNILEITEFYDKTGFHIYAIFGSIPRDLLTEMRDNSQRLDDLENNPLNNIDLEAIKDLLIPLLIDEIFDALEFDDLPDWFRERIRTLVEETTNEVFDVRLRPAVIEILEELLLGIIIGGSGGHIILDHLPTQTEIDLFPLDAEVLVYDPNNPYIPP